MTEQEIEAERTKRNQRNYHAAMENVETLLIDAMCETLRKMTGKIPGERFREKVRDALFDFI